LQYSWLLGLSFAAPGFCCTRFISQKVGIIMQSEKEEILCPLCHGHGREHKELLVVRWRSREFELALQNIADEAAFGTTGGLDSPFEIAEPVYSNESD
jgi:hypothetical protein